MDAILVMISFFIFINISLTIIAICLVIYNIVNKNKAPKNVIIEEKKEKPKKLGF